MIPAQSSPDKRESSTTSSFFKTTIPQEMFIYSNAYLLLTFLLDVVILIQNVNYCLYIVPKLGITLLFMLLLTFYFKRVKLFLLNLCLILTKLYSICHLIILGQECLLVVAFVCESNYICIKKETLEICLQRLFIKTGCLIFIIINSQLLEILFMISILLLEFIKVIQNINLNQKVNDFDNPEENQEQILQENQIINDSQSFPTCLILLTKKNTSVKFKNQNVNSIFSQCCQSEEELDNLILDKLKFTIIGDNVQNQIKISQDNSFQKSIFSLKQSQQETEKYKIIEKFSLREILSKYEVNYIFQCSYIIQIELYCNFTQEQSNDQIFAGQLIIHNEKDEVVLLLIDISKQHKIQEHIIKDQFKATLIQSFSHELRTPLNSSCNFLQFLLNCNEIPEQIKGDLIQPALNSLHLQSYLINDIIDFSAITSENIQINIREIKIKEIVDEINKLFKSLIEMKNLILYIDLSENQLETISTDFSRLIQILVNLIQNSIKYSNQGSIIIKLTSYVQNQLKFTIKDEGYGIEQSRLEQISQMLQGMESKKQFAESKVWHGFGLLISSMLLQKLRPSNYKSLLIRSQGFQKGTKVTFYVKNHKHTETYSSQNVKDKQLHFQNKYKGNSITDSIKNISYNGTMIQISDIFISQNRLQINQKLINKRKQSSSFGSYESQSLSDSIKIMDCDYTIGEFQHLHAFVFTECEKQQNKKSKQEYSPSNNALELKILNYQKLKQVEDQEKDQCLQLLFKQVKKCMCNKILSVDDEIFNQKSLQYLLSQHGFEIILAFNGEEAIKIVQASQKCCDDCCLFLLILMDYQMPVMNGLQATKNFNQLMELNKIPYIPIVGLTAFNSRNDIDKCIQSGMIHVLTKPLIINEFFDILRKL